MKDENTIMFLRRHEEQIFGRDQFTQFIKLHIQWIEVRLMLVGGGIDYLGGLKRPQFGICFNALTTDPWPKYAIQTAHHELFHAYLSLSGINDHTEYEDEIERLCLIFAERYPFILEILQDIFPGLSFTKEFFREAFRQPVRIYQPVF